MRCLTFILIFLLAACNGWPLTTPLTTINEHEAQLAGQRVWVQGIVLSTYLRQEDRILHYTILGEDKAQVTIKMSDRVKAPQRGDLVRVRGFVEAPLVVQGIKARVRILEEFHEVLHRS